MVKHKQIPIRMKRINYENMCTNIVTRTTTTTTITTTTITIITMTATLK